MKLVNPLLVILIVQSSLFASDSTLVKEVFLIDKNTGEVTELTEKIKLDSNQFIDLKKVDHRIKAAATITTPILYLPAAEIGKKFPILNKEGVKLLGNFAKSNRNAVVAVLVGAAGATYVLSQTELVKTITTKTEVMRTEKIESDSNLFVSKTIRVTRSEAIWKYAVYFSTIIIAGLLSYLFFRKFIKK